MGFTPAPPPAGHEFGSWPSFSSMERGWSWSLSCQVGLRIDGDAHEGACSSAWYTADSQSIRSLLLLLSFTLLLLSQLLILPL